MAEQIKFDSNWWKAWQEDPNAVARKNGWEIPKEWQSSAYWKKMTQEEGKELLSASRWGSWFWWG